MAVCRTGKQPATGNGSRSEPPSNVGSQIPHKGRPGSRIETTYRTRESMTTRGPCSGDGCHPSDVAAPNTHGVGVQVVRMISSFAAH